MEKEDALQEQLGVPVITLKSGPAGVFDENFFATLRMLGLIFQNEEKAEALIGYIEAERADISARTADIPEADKPSVYICGLGNWGTTNHLMTAPNYISFNVANVRNVVSDLANPGIQPIADEMAKKFSTHGGSDFYPTHFFIEKILGNPDGEKYSIDVYQAVDMGICGILAYRSALSGNQPMAVPNLRNKAERDAWRNDNKCTNPAVAQGDDLLPCYPGGNMDYPDSVYDEVRRIWLSGQNAEWHSAAAGR